MQNQQAQFYRRWNGAQHAELKALHAQGLDRWDIATALGRTAASVAGKISQLGLLHENGELTWTPEREAILADLWAQGLSAACCAARLGGITRNAVLGKVHRMGLPRRITAGGPPSYLFKTAGSVVVRASGQKRKQKALSDRQEQRDSERKIAKAKRQQAAAQYEADGFKPSAEIDIPLAERKTLIMLADHDCHWPIGDPKAAGFHYCGRPEGERGLGYCQHHFLRLHVDAPSKWRYGFMESRTRQSASCIMIPEAVDNFTSTPPHKPPLALETV